MTINTANLGFEKNIWSAADKLRGNVDASEYKHVVLGLIFLKYISDSFEEKYLELKEEGAGFEEARWDFIARYANDQEIGQVIDKAMVEIEKENIIGRTYEYCLAMFAEQEGRRAGEFYTPSSIVRTLVEILEPYNGRVYDPACGERAIIMTCA